MIYVGTALKQEEIKETLEKELGYKFIAKKGIKMQFEHEGVEASVAVDKAKSAIKNTSYGKVLYFSVKDNEFGA